MAEAYEVHCLEIRETMRQTAFLLGNITGYTGFVIPPQMEETRLDRVVLLRMDARLFLMVLISDIGVVEHRLVPLQEDLAQEEIAQITQIIDSTLHGVTLSAIRELTLKENPDGWHERPVRQALLLLGRLLERRSQKHLFYEGLLNLVDDLQEVDSERSLEQFTGLIHAVQDEAAFTDAIRGARGDRRGPVAFVGDPALPGLEGYSVVTCDYRPHAGALGVIGPLWMDYGRVLSATTYIAHRLETLLVSSCTQSSER